MLSPTPKNLSHDIKINSLSSLSLSSNVNGGDNCVVILSTTQSNVIIEVKIIAFLGEDNFIHLSPKLVPIVALLWSSVPIGECNIKTWEHASSLGECNVHVEFLMCSHLGT